jgi:Protein of unknown function (DUF1592)/Protein of unknown function (DUF1588)/Protein of unknown function (DUF1595)/Protein of unknown function (DUF1585)/Protein of unknown function (DUF1587)
MNTWTRTLIVGAALLAGCEGSIGSSKVSGSGTGASSGTGTGNTIGSGTGNTTGSGTAGSSVGSGTGGSVGMPVDPTVCTPGVPTTSQLPRLTRAEYDKTARDLLGIDITTTPPSSMLAPDTIGSVDQRAWDGFQGAADALATQVVGNATLKASVLGCTASGDGTACATTFITNFGQKAFRRPLTATELSKFQALYTNRATLTQSGTFDQAVQVILKAFLMSPSFLTKAELSEATPDGSYYALNSWEMASRLSYTLWGTMPDATLMTAAQQNKLTAPADILAQAQRMLQDPKARAKVADFHAVYALQGDATRWSEAAHDPTLFPAFKTTMVPTLTAEAAKFFDYITFDLKGTFQDLITKPVAFVDKDLAPIYGLSAASYGTTLTMVDLDATQRAGVFTHAGFLASYSSYNRTSPILRGAFLEKQVLCRQIPAPPDGAASTALPPASTDLNTNRKQVAAQTEVAGSQCVGCHGPVVNPAGFALESYDSIGQWQTTEKSTGAMIDSTANVAIGNNVMGVTGPVDLMTKIAASPEGQNCYAQRLVTFAYERDLTSQDVCTVQTLAGKMNTSGYNIIALLTDLTQTQSFRYRAKELP